MAGPGELATPVRREFSSCAHVCLAAQDVPAIGFDENEIDSPANGAVDGDLEPRPPSRMELREQGIEEANLDVVPQARPDRAGDAQ